MSSTSLYLLAADGVLALHMGFVAFVILGLLFIFVGWWRAWSWVRSPAFRLAHLLAIVVVALQAWLGVLCPLTTLEMMLRARAGDEVYTGTFVSHWLQTLLYYEAPEWVFVACYSVLGGMVLASWFLVRPRAWKGRTMRGAAQPSPPAG